MIIHKTKQLSISTRPENGLFNPDQPVNWLSMFDTVDTIQADIPQDCGPRLPPFSREFYSDPRPGSTYFAIVFGEERFERFVYLVYRSLDISGFGSERIYLLAIFCKRAVRHYNLL
jgi:hypothetical protein